MAAITVDATKVSLINPLTALLRNFVAAAAGEIGDWVYEHTDGTILLADATDTLAEAAVIGQVIATEKSIGGDTSGAFAVGDTVTVAIGNALVDQGDDITLTIPGRLHISATAGKADQTAPAVSGNYVYAPARAVTARIILINPPLADPVVVP